MMFEFEGTDPVSAAQEAADAISRAKREVEARGIKTFLFHSASPEEFDQRVSIREVSEVIATTSDKYLGSREGHAKITAALRREFVGQRFPYDNEQGYVYTDDNAGREQEFLDNEPGEAKADTGPEGQQDWPYSGQELVDHVEKEHKKSFEELGDDPWLTHDRWHDEYQRHTHPQDPKDYRRSSKSKEHKDKDWVEKAIKHPGKLTREVGGKPSEHPEKVHDLAEKGDKAALFYENVLSSAKRARCSTCGDIIERPRDEDSLREASTSGMCQNCQDDFFGIEKESTVPYTPCPACGGDDPDCELCEGSGIAQTQNLSPGALEDLEREREHAVPCGVCGRPATVTRGGSWLANVYCHLDRGGFHSDESPHVNCGEHGNNLRPDGECSGCDDVYWNGQEDVVRKAQGTVKQAKGCDCTCEPGGDCSCGKKCGKSCKCKCTRKKKSSTNDLPAWVRDAQLGWADEKQGEVT